MHEAVAFSNMKQERKIINRIKGNIQSKECDIEIRYISTIIRKDVAKEWISEKEKIEELTQEVRENTEKKLNKCER